jgi:uncharacterized protein (TIGR02466 family)
MNARIEVRPAVLWPTILYSSAWPDHARQASAILAHLYELKAAQTANVASGIATSAKSRHGLFESDFRLLESTHSGLVQLKAFLEEAVRMAVANVNNTLGELKKIRPRIVESWFHITNDGGFHDAHYHNQCSWCGIYYLQAGDCKSTDASGPGNGVNRFYSPLPSGGAYFDYGNSYLSNNRADIVPTDGMVLLFPSYLLHSALAYRGEKDRITISFNCQVARE